MSRAGIVIIGRNEGDRLIRCIASAKLASDQIVYVDSGSVDASVTSARELGAIVVELDRQMPFTAARARNFGWRELLRQRPGMEFVHFIDGDCEFHEGWVAKAVSFLCENEGYAVACGRRVERFPEASVYNQLCNLEWDTPVGDALACGGDALFRVSALQDAGGYREELIAGEEPELCLRLRGNGWKIRRIGDDMTFHDAAMLKFSQWWKRSQRCGFAFAIVSDLHRKDPQRYWVAETRRAIFWGGLLPIVISLLAIASPWFLMSFLVYLLQWLRLRRRSAISGSAWAYFVILGKIPEFLGVARYRWLRLTGRQMRLIEYK